MGALEGMEEMEGQFKRRVRAKLAMAHLEVLGAQGVLAVKEATELMEFPKRFISYLAILY
jgi:hypothetical protein